MCLNWMINLIGSTERWLLYHSTFIHLIDQFMWPWIVPLSLYLSQSLSVHKQTRSLCVCGFFSREWYKLAWKVRVETIWSHLKLAFFVASIPSSSFACSMYSCESVISTHLHNHCDDERVQFHCINFMSFHLDSDVSRQRTEEVHKMSQETN